MAVNSYQPRFEKSRLEKQINEWSKKEKDLSSRVLLYLVTFASRQFEQGTLSELFYFFNILMLSRQISWDPAKYRFFPFIYSYIFLNLFCCLFVCIVYLNVEMIAGKTSESKWQISRCAVTIPSMILKGKCYL